jgi:type II secretory pathway component PulF
MLFKYQAPYKGFGRDDFPRHSGLCSGPELLTASLAWAARNNVPFQRVIPTLTDTGGIKTDPSGLSANGRWNRALWLLESDLRAGLPLSCALRKRMADRLPGYFLSAVERAEKDGTLRATLEGFAKRSAFFAELRMFRVAACWGPVFEFGIIFFLSSAVLLFSCRKFGLIIEELTDGAPLGWGLQFAKFFGRDILGALANLFYPLLAFGALYWFFKFFRDALSACASEIFIRVPFLKRFALEPALLGLSASFAAYLSAGRDILDAAVFSRDACENFWLRKRLDVFIKDVSGGGDWIKAWAALAHDHPVASWAVCSSAACGSPAAGFDTLSEWLYYRVSASSRVNTILLFVAIVLLSASLVSFIVFTMFGALVSILNVCAGV